MFIETYGINMLPYYYLYEAKQRLAHAKKTIVLMGGEDECQAMLLGQRDMLELEVEYYQSQSKKFTIGLLTFVLIGSILVMSYGKGYINV